MNRKQQIAASFSAAAGTYNGAADVQRRAAGFLAERVLAHPLPAHPQVLEVGCGTGLLTRRLKPLIGGQWIVTDVAPAMVDAARAALTDNDVHFRVMDAEHPDVPAGSVDLLVSNLAAQWFEDLPSTLSALTRCLKPGGRMILTTLGGGTFPEWRQAHCSLGFSCGTPSYPSCGDLTAMAPSGTLVSAQILHVLYPNALAFMRSLRAIGAATPREGHMPLSPKALRQIMANLGGPCKVTYEIVTMEYRQ